MTCQHEQPQGHTHGDDGGRGNGGHHGERISRLEEAVKHTAKLDDLTDIKVSLGTIVERLDHVPTKTWILGAILAAVPTLVLIMLGVIRLIDSLLVLVQSGN